MFHVVFCFFSIMGVKVQINLVGDSYLPKIRNYHPIHD